MTLRDDEIEALLRESRAERFAAGFAGRVVRRARETRQPSLDAALQRWFVRVVPAAAVAIVMLALHNARASRGTGHGIDALLALQPVTLDAAYSLDASTPAP
jgi:hypothetical protein